MSRALELEPTLGVLDVERVFDPGGMSRLDRTVEADGTAGIELSQAVHGNLEVVAESAADDDEAFGVFVEDGLIEGLYVRGAIGSIDADIPEFEGVEAFGRGLDLGGPFTNFGFVEHVFKVAVGVDGRGGAYGTAQQLIERLIEDFSGEVPERDVYTADSGDVRPRKLCCCDVMREKWRRDGERVLADEELLKALDAGAGRRRRVAAGFSVADGGQSQFQCG